MADERYRRDDEGSRRDHGQGQDRRRPEEGQYRDYGFGRENDGPYAEGRRDDGPGGYRSESYGHARERSGGAGRSQGRSGSGYGLSGALGPGYTGRGGDEDYGGGYSGHRGSPGQNYGREYRQEPGLGDRFGGFSHVGGGGGDYGSWGAKGSYLGSGGTGQEAGTGRHDRPELQGEHRGRGPRGYRRSDQRILEDVSDRLTEDPSLDASDIEVGVDGSEVTLSGMVRRREDKRRAEDLAEQVSGVNHVQNNLRVG
ncbi:MAG TPA: BON domain-containing protein [Geminicoccus sp.]|jgi:hypothetical protein|uniref:BON domain-containing protein n=1 Tax=Geminicoccus sp. TaxID=2024832 RepID=UPI002E2FB0C0|nr:BON domain-containing protein [Geminicoccus sp.]HEX2527350.1 BON domain-containing protein [Geminicoccus sp.]